MVKWYKTYLEVYGKSFDEISDDSIRKVKSKNVKTILHWYRLYSLHTMRNAIW